MQHEFKYDESEIYMHAFSLKFYIYKYNSMASIQYIGFACIQQAVESMILILHKDLLLNTFPVLWGKHNMKFSVSYICIGRTDFGL
jgi:hypothetical protein